MTWYPNKPRASRVTHVRLWAFLTRLDEDAAAECRKKGCPHCGRDALRRADHPRAGWGLPASLRGNVTRIGFRCYGQNCGRRTMPPSVRYFGRRFHVAPLFLTMSAMLLGGQGPGELGKGLPLRASTLRRWRRWWHEEFSGTVHWRRLRLELPALSPGREPLLFLLDQAARRGCLTRKVLRAPTRFRPWERAHGPTPVH